MNLNSNLPTVVLSIETATRELDSKLVIASALASRGCRAVVGHKEAVKALCDASEGLLWQGKSLFSSKSNDHFANHLKANNSAAMFIHDEGGMHQVKAWSHHVLKTHRVDFLRKSDVSSVCVWGERQKQVLSDYAAELGSITKVTGTPKFDLCSAKYSWVTSRKSKEKRDRYGHYILACTRFGTAVHSQGQEDPFRRKLNPALWPSNLDQKAVADLWYLKWHRDVHDFADFVLLIKEIANNYPDKSVILRPHPSENVNFYKHAFSAFENVMVTREDSVIPWIRSAELVLHSNCTTGIEAVLAGRPVLNLLPASPGRTQLDVEVAREAGVIANCIDDALEKVDKLLSGSAPAPMWSNRARKILNNLSVESLPLLIAETMRVLEDTRIDSSIIQLPKEHRLRNILKRFTKSQATTYAESKRGPLDQEYVEEFLEGCRLNDVGEGRLRHFSKNYVVVDPM